MTNPVIYSFWICLFFSKALGQCPDGYVSHHTSCYKEFNIRASWIEAQTYCEAYGGHLVTVNDDNEQAFITGHLQREGPGAFQPGIFWLGASDAWIEGRWIWPDNSTVRHSYWKAGEPNNAGAHGENCLGIAFTDNLLWNDNPCSLQNNFICENEKGSGGGVNIIG